MNHRHKKKFGQNFLKDPSVVQKILQAARLDAGSQVVEIGPGLGALTHHLGKAAGSLTVFEIDADLIDYWKTQQLENLHLIEGDVLKMPWRDILREPPYVMVANLPYNISSQVVFKLLEHRDLFSRLVLMFQKEVADRLKAEPSTKDYGILSVLCRRHFDIRQLCAVPPGAFHPAPKVHSSVLCFESLASPRYPGCDEDHLRKVVKAGFGQRRKTLQNALSSAGFSREAIACATSDNRIDPMRRGETLSLGEFVALSESLRGLEPA